MKTNTKTSICVTLRRPTALVVGKITYYENLPGEFFEFEIPDGATVIEP